MYSRRKNKMFTNILLSKNLIEIVVILKENINDLEFQLINNSEKIAKISVINIKSYLLVLENVFVKILKVQIIIIEKVV